MINNFFSSAVLLYILRTLEVEVVVEVDNCHNLVAAGNHIQVVEDSIPVVVGNHTPEEGTLVDSHQ
jgi:hypothetical protein